MSKSIITSLEKWEAVVDNNEAEFVATFCDRNTLILGNIAWNSSTMKVVYVLACGQHVANSFPMAQWIEFYDKFK